MRLSGGVQIYALSMSDRQLCHEKDFAGASIGKDRQDRCISFLGSANHRGKFNVEPAHFNWLGEHCSYPTPPKIAHAVKKIYRLVRSKGAEQAVWVISEDPNLDGHEREMEDALSTIWVEALEAFCRPYRESSLTSRMKRSLDF